MVLPKVVLMRGKFIDYMMPKLEHQRMYWQIRTSTAPRSDYIHIAGHRCDLMA